MATHYVESNATLWLQAFRITRPVLTWNVFRLETDEELGPQKIESLMHKLVMLRQTA